MYNQNFNAFNGNNQYYRPNYQPLATTGYNQPNFAPISQPQVQNPADIPFSSIKFVTLDEAKGYIVNPNTKEMLVNKSNNLVFIKSANNVGDSVCQVFQYKEVNLDELAKQQEEMNKPIDTSQFITNEQASGFATTSQIEELAKKIDNLQRQIKIKEILGEDDGK